MKIYRNGKLWQSGTGKFKPVRIADLNIGAPSSYNGPYYGRLRELSIWNVALDSAMINSWRNKTLTSAHPIYDKLVYYYSLQDNDGMILNDKSADPLHLNLPVSLNRHRERGDKLLLDFSAVSNRPNVTFLKGSYNGLKSDSLYVLDSIPAGPRKVTKYRVSNNDLFIDSVFYIYAALYDNVYYENGTIAESIIIDPEDYLEITNLKYYIKTPAKFELLSLVTPYGNNLDLGVEGKTFIFDVTDFTPLLRGRKLLSMELGGENQEEIDLKFQFIKGIPERKVVGVSNIWPFQRGYFSEILMNSRFEARKLKLPLDAESYKLRFSVTGHEQNGEFVQRNHFVNVNGSANKKFPFTVWKECGWNPIYPQGGTWIFDRAGWCPGAPTELHQFDISDLIPTNKEITVDYGLEPPQLDQANYLVSGQLISYGPYHFRRDASIEEIVRPNRGRVEFERLNPSCNKPTIIIRNAGSDILSSLDIRYGMKNGIKETYNWSGNLPSSKTATIELPVTNPDFWIPGPDSLYVFEVELLNPNQGNDENISNNKKESPFRKVDSYSTNLFFEFKTNNVPLDNQYKIVNSQGITVLERNNMTLNTQYRDELLLPPGCYTLYVTDASNDGLYFWFYAGNGNGFSRLMRKVNNALIPVKTFNPDFGAGYQYDFVIAQPTSTVDKLTPMLISIAPNPVKDEVNIAFEATGTGEAMIRLLNSNGGLLTQQIVRDLNGRQSLNWNVDGLAAGLYFIEIRLGNNTYTRKFIKQ